MKEITHGVGRALELAKSLMMNLFVGLAAITVITQLFGGTNAAAIAAIAIVMGGEIILRGRKKKVAKFGEVARGSEVQDHTDKP